MNSVFFLIAVFLAGAVSGALLVFVVSIHRTSRTPLSENHGRHAGSVSRRLLAGIRTDKTEAGR
jgi:hypothetical protein